MEFKDIWNQLCRKDPRLNDLDVKVEFRGPHLKQLLEQVYEQGRKSAPKKDTSLDFSGLFDNIFKGKS